MELRHADLFRGLASLIVKPIARVVTKHEVECHAYAPIFTNISVIDVQARNFLE